MRTLTALVAGLLFGGGLLVSGMTNPAVVLGFLDVAGSWNPALAFTMAGAIAVSAPAFYFVRRQQKTVLGEAAPLSRSGRVDAPLVAGSAVFGVGWGLSGICPGPSLILLTGASMQAFVFVGAMAAGMLASRWVTPLQRWRAPMAPAAGN